MSKCKEHPRYQVKRKPRGDCPACWAMWDAKQKEEECTFPRVVDNIIGWG